MAWFFSGCSSGPEVNYYSEQFSGQGSNPVYVVSHGWHTGLVISADKIQQIIPQLKSRFGHTDYIEFGWGDMGFYQASEITSGLILKAIFWPTDSVLHSVAVPRNVESYFSNSEVVLLCMNDAEFSSLNEFIGNSFHRVANGNILELQKGVYGNSQFYKAEGDYYLMNTCNKWTAKALKSAGMNISTTFKLTTESIMDFVKSFNLNLYSTSGSTMNGLAPLESCRK